MSLFRLRYEAAAATAATSIMRRLLRTLGSFPPFRWVRLMWTMIVRRHLGFLSLELLGPPSNLPQAHTMIPQACKWDFYRQCSQLCYMIFTQQTEKCRDQNNVKSIRSVVVSVYFASNDVIKVSYSWRHCVWGSFCIFVWSHFFDGWFGKLAKSGNRIVFDLERQLWAYCDPKKCRKFMRWRWMKKWLCEKKLPQTLFPGWLTKRSWFGLLLYRVEVVVAR